MVYEVRKQPMTWMETDYSKYIYFRWKIKWRLEYLGALGIMGETDLFEYCILSSEINKGNQSQREASISHQLYLVSAASS